MSPTVDAKVTSPASLENKVQDGRVQKPKTKKREGIVPNYRIDGRTFACEGCKNGHRVSKCTHAAQRPVLMTNDPGRPSADQKRHCDCPKTCTCTTKNCKCDRNCTCTQTMYMLVYVPLGEKESDEDKQKGEWRIDREVITDLKGKQLTADEIKIRRQEKSRQQQGRTSRADGLGVVNNKRPASQVSTTRFAASVTIKAEESDTNSISTPKSGCCHRSNIQKERSIEDVQYENANSIQAKRPLGDCNCGDNCACAMCLDHPNNKTSQRIIHQQAARFPSNVQPLRQNTVNQSFHTPPEERSLCCTGTNPQFAWHTRPNPSIADLHDIFGSDNMTGRGYCLAYPVGGYSTGPAAPQRSCCSSTMSSSRSGSSTRQGSSQFLPSVDPNAELLSPMHPQPNQDFAMASGFLPEQVGLRSDFQTSLSHSGENFQSERYVGQATVAGVYGMGNEWANFCASHPMPQLWSSTSSDLEPCCHSPSVIPDFKTNAVSFSPVAPSRAASQFNATSATTGLTSNTPTLRHDEWPGCELGYQYLPAGQDHSLGLGYFPPGIPPPSTYTPDLFESLPPITEDFFVEMTTSTPAYNSPDVGVAHTYPT